MKTIGVGLITEPADADQVIRDGDADLIALARAVLWDPRWPWHAAAARWVRRSRLRRNIGGASRAVRGGCSTARRSGSGRFVVVDKPAPDRHTETLRRIHEGDKR